MRKQLVIVGAGHAHLTILKNLKEFKNAGHDVTVVSSSSLHYYSGMGPGMLSGIYRPDEIRFNVKKMSQDRGAVFIEDKVVKIHPRKKKMDLHSGQTLSYDVMSVNTGSFVPVEAVDSASDFVIPVKPIENLLSARYKVIEALKKKELRITVVGGGPTGVEVAGNLDRLVRDESGKCRITLVAGTRLLRQFKTGVRNRVQNALARRQVRVIEGARVSAIKNNSVLLTGGSDIESDIVFMAVGVKPSTLFEDSGIPVGQDGGMQVNQYLQSVSYPEIFGGGDCISFEPQPLAKVGVYAVRQNPILFNNLLSFLKGAALERFLPQKSILLAFNLGDGTAVVQWHSLVWGGRLGFALKDYIDKTFMKKFQISGELEPGAVDGITNSVAPANLIARIKNHLDLRKTVDELREAKIKIEALKSSMEKELTVGRKIQERIVPSDFPAFPDNDEFDVYASLQPAREFDGDFYDFFLIGDDRFCFCIGHVAGQGLQAALFMSVTETVIKSRAGDDFSPASILTHVNEQLSAVNPASMSVVLFIGILNIKTGKLLYSNAGHNPPCLKSDTGAIERLDRIHGPLIGTARGMVYQEDQTTLSKNDTLLLCSDGVTRAGADKENRFSEKRLRELLSSGEYESVRHMVRAAVSEAKKITGTADQVKDMTLLAVQFTRNPEDTGGPKLELTVPNLLSENARVKEHFDTFAEHYGIPDPIRLKMHVVIDELLMNIISYAYPDDDRHDICIKVELSADRLKVSMVDDGIPFNPLGMETPDTELSLEEREIGGLGIHLIRKMMDRVSYRRRIDKNVITVLKFLNTDT